MYSRIRQCIKKKKRRLAGGGGVNETVVYFIKERSLDTLIKILHTKKHEKKSIFSPKQKQNKKPKWHNPHSSQNLANRH